MDENKKFIFPVLVLLSIVVITSILLLNYKKETLVCSKSDDMCYLERINLVNIKSTKKLLKYSDVGKISYMPMRVKGNRYAKGYTSYLLTFYTKNNNPVIIFSTEYFDKDEVKKAATSLNSLLHSNVEVLKFER